MEFNQQVEGREIYNGQQPAAYKQKIRQPDQQQSHYARGVGAKIDLLSFIQYPLDIGQIFQICFEDCWRGGSIVSLSDSHPSRLFKRFGYLAAQKARCTGD